MKTQLIFLIGFAFLLTQCGNNKGPKAAESNDGTQWTWLFDGSSTENWRDLKSEEFPKQGWVINNGVLTVLGKTDEHSGGRDIITKKLYGNFELELEVNLSEGANSGIKYQVTDSFPGNEGKFLGLEYQLLDNERHPDAHEGRDGNHKMAALYDVMPPMEDITIHPPGEWNKVRIVLDGDRIEHWINDEKVLEIDRKSHTFRELVGLSKYNNLEKFGELDKGRILLQGHGNDVSFRNIKIRTW